MSYNKRRFKQTRESFSNIITPTTPTIANTPTTPTKKIRTRSPSGIDDINHTLDEIFRQNARILAIMEEVLDRVRKLEEGSEEVDKDFIKVINFNLTYLLHFSSPTMIYGILTYFTLNYMIFNLFRV